MSSGKKIINNTVILYIKLIVTGLLSFITVPIILDTLGESDYGLYNLIAGIVTMLAFIQTSLSSSINRHLSFANGKGDAEEINHIFNSAIITQVLLGIAVVIFLEILSIFLMNGGLNIDSGREFSAKVIYQCVVFSTFITMCIVPFQSVLFSNEKFLLIAIIDTIDSLMKLLIAISMIGFSGDKLIFFGIAIASISIVELFCYVCFVKLSCRQYSFDVRKKYSRESIKKLLSFGFWESFETMSVLGKNQGTAVIFNHIGGTVLNAAYGIANQVNGVLSRFNVTFQSSIAPQAIQSEGKQDRERLWRFCYIGSKYSIIIYAAVAIPILLELPYLLNWWLKNVPQYTIEFCQILIIYILIQQARCGLDLAISAVGKIKNYKIISGFIELINIPLIYILIHNELSVAYSLCGFVIIESLRLVSSILYVNKLCGMSSMDFIKKNILRPLICILLGSGFALLVKHGMHEGLLRLIITVVIFETVFFPSVWLFAMNKSEKDFSKGLLLNKIRNKNHE